MRSFIAVGGVLLLSGALSSGCSDDDAAAALDRDASAATGADSGGGSGDKDAAPGPDAGAGAGGDGADAAVATEETREHDDRTFTIDEATLPFAALPDAAETDRWWGVLEGAGYQVEVPKTWNGMLVMYAHGYAGTAEALRVTMPSIRRHLIDNGYAWAASSYTTNYYDVRAGVEDTNALALAFAKIAGDNGRTLAAPSKTYIIGHSMGGHVAGAAIEKEALETANHTVKYDGAVPMCGVMGDTELFDYFAAFQVAVQQLAGMPVTSWPVADFMSIEQAVKDALFTTFPAVTTAQGDKLKAIVINLTGGQRPLGAEGFSALSGETLVWSTFGRDGKVNGILNKDIVDTREFQYQLDSEPALTADEKTFNDSAYRVSGDPAANRLRRDGLRWIPKVNAEFDIPVVTIHTLGDLYVPFKMQQIYLERAKAKGSDKLLVQRAVRSVGHCEFSRAEQIAAFDAMVKWEQEGVKPAGDDVLDPAIVSKADYGCAFTNNVLTAEEEALRKAQAMQAMRPPPGPFREGLPACP